MAEQEDLALAIAGLEIVDQFDRVVAIAIQRHGRRERLGIVERIAFARAALVPLDDGEEILPWPLEGPGEGHFHRAGAAMDIEEDRVGPIGAAHIDRLPRAAQGHDEIFLHAVRRNDAVDVGDDGLGRSVGIGGLLRRNRRSKKRKRQNGAHQLSHSIPSIIPLSRISMPPRSYEREVQ